MPLLPPVTKQCLPCNFILPFVPRSARRRRPSTSSTVAPPTTAVQTVVFRRSPSMAIISAPPGRPRLSARISAAAGCWVCDPCNATKQKEGRVRYCCQASYDTRPVRAAGGCFAWSQCCNRHFRCFFHHFFPLMKPRRFFSSGIKNSPNQAISHTVGFVSRKRPFSTEAQIRLSYPVEKLDFFHWICQSKNSVEKVLHLFFEPIASLIPPQNTPPHAHTPIPGTTQQYHTTAPTLPWLSLLLLLAASQRGALLAPLASSMYHTTAVARVIDDMLPTTATPVAWRLSAECNATTVASAAFG